MCSLQLGATTGDQMCVCVCVRERERERENTSPEPILTKRTISQSIMHSLPVGFFCNAHSNFFFFSRNGPCLLICLFVQQYPQGSFSRSHNTLGKALAPGFKPGLKPGLCRSLTVRLGTTRSPVCPSVLAYKQGWKTC